MRQYKRLSIIFTVFAVFSGISVMCNRIAASDEMKGDRPGRENSLAKTPEIDKKYLLGQFDPASEGNFVKVKTPYAHRDHLYLLRDVHEAFIKMHRAAKADGISLTIISATRNYDDQKRIWQSKWTGQRLVDKRNLAKTVPDPVKRARIILKYSAMPGTSRHHWGTDIDINSVNTAYFESGKGLKTYQWLARHAGRFGFVQPYTPKGKDRPHGYEEEPWHWTYNPMAKGYTRQYLKKISYEDINGFDGSETAPKIDVIKHYVLGINRACLK